MQHNRRVKNYLINPIVQLRMAGLTIASLLIFAVVFSTVGYLSLEGLAQGLIELTEIPEEVRAVVAAEVGRAVANLAAVLLVFVLFTSLLVILESHRVVGAAYAVKRFVTQSLLEGKYSDRLILRKGDLLLDVGDAVNALAEKLEKSAPVKKD